MVWQSKNARVALSVMAHLDCSTEVTAVVVFVQPPPSAVVAACAMQIPSVGIYHDIATQVLVSACGVGAN